MRISPAALIVAVMLTVGCHAGGGASSAHAEPSSQTSKPRGSVRLDRGVIVDRATNTVFFSDPNSRVVAVDGESGAPRWRSSDAVSPLVVQGSLLLATNNGSPGQPGGLSVVDVVTGKTLRSCAVPEGVTLMQSDGPGSTSDVVAVDIGDVVQVVAHSSSQYAGGMAPTPEMALAASSSSESRFQVNLKTCAVQVESQSAAQGASAMAVSAGVGDGSALAPGSIVAEAKQEQQSGEQSVVLVRTQNGKPLPTLTLVKVSKGYPIAYMSADRQHVSVVQYSAKGQDMDVFATATGAKVAHFSTQSAPIKFIVVGTTLVALPPAQIDPSTRRPKLEVRGFSMSSGNERWAKEVRDRDFHGSLPPSMAPGLPSSGKGLIIHD